MHGDKHRDNLLLGDVQNKVEAARQQQRVRHEARPGTARLRGNSTPRRSHTPIGPGGHGLGATAWITALVDLLLLTEKQRVHDVRCRLCVHAGPFSSVVSSRSRCQRQKYCDDFTVQLLPIRHVRAQRPLR